MFPLELPKGYWLDSVDSTMEEAKRLIASGKVAGCAFVVANHQTQGRGTQGRVWSSPAGHGLYLSVIHVAPDWDPMALSTAYTQAAGVACVEALKDVAGVEVRLKPINDLYVQGFKLGGILVESDLQAQGGLKSLITGVGINLKATDHTLDRGTVRPISLEDILGTERLNALNLDTLTETLVAKICFWHALVMNQQVGQVERAWEKFKLSI